MNKIKLNPISIENDLPEILSWDARFAGTEDYASIEKFIFEDWLIRGMGELIETNYENFEIGEDEKKVLLVAKDESGNIVGFTIQSIFNLSTKPEVFCSI